MSNPRCHRLRKNRPLTRLQAPALPLPGSRWVQVSRQKAANRPPKILRSQAEPVQNPRSVPRPGLKRRFLGLFVSRVMAPNKAQLWLNRPVG